MAHEKIRLYFFGALFVGVIALTILIMLPYLPTMAVAAVLAVMAYPVFVRIKRQVRFEGLAAFLTVLFTALLIVTPLLIIGTLLFQEAQQLTATLQRGGMNSVESLLAPLQGRIEQFAPQAELDVEEVINTASSWLVNNLAGFFANTAQMALLLFIVFIALFYLLKDGDRLVKAVVRLSPLDDQYDQEILEKLRLSVNSIVTGTLMVAVVQGFLVGLGFYLVGLPNPVLWGTVGAFAALLPGVGTALVLAPAVLYLFVTGSTVAAFILLIWGVIIVGTIDNLLAPRLMGRHIEIHPLFILLSVLGGLSFFGPSGFLIGPLLLSLLFALGHIYTLVIDNPEQELLEDELR